MTRALLIATALVAVAPEAFATDWKFGMVGRLIRVDRD